MTAILFWMDQNGLSARDQEPFPADRAEVTVSPGTASVDHIRKRAFSNGTGSGNTG